MRAIHSMTNAELDDVALRLDRIRQAPHLEVLQLSNVQPKPIEWLWKDRIAIGKVTVLAGDGGQGPSSVILRRGQLPASNGRMAPAAAILAGSSFLLPKMTSRTR